MRLPTSTLPGQQLEMVYSDPVVPSRFYPGWVLPIVYVGFSREPDRVNWFLQSAGERGILVFGHHESGIHVGTWRVGDWWKKYFLTHKGLCETVRVAIDNWPDKSINPWGVAK